jgi:formate--tetrahydrofolate ligase
MNIDLKIAQEAELKHVNEIAAKLNISEEDLEHYGKYKAKLPLDLIDEEQWKKNKMILVTAMTPTPAGEGKTTVSIGLTEGMNKIGKRTTVVLREPSLGPVFGIKGGAAGGGHSQVIPMEDINLHFTGDFSAVEKTNNLLAAIVDNNIQNKKNNLRIDPRRVIWKRVMDMNDRALRDITIGLGGIGNGVPRQDGFNITPASEIMAILCLANDRSDLKEKLGNILVGFTYEREPIYARQLNVVGAMAILLKDAIKPNLVQTLEGNPAIIHGGPFANIAQGTNTVIATKMGLSLSDYVVTEAGFASDLGAEKFMNIKCGGSGLKPSAVVVVATIKALKYHGGVALADLNETNVDAVKKGFPNLAKHVENVQHHNIQPVVAINHFVHDADDECQAVIDLCEEMGVKAVISKGWAEGGNGTQDLARVVAEVVDNDEGKFERIYDWKSPVRQKIETIAAKMYGAVGVDFTAKAEADMRLIDRLGLNELPICMAKTQKSLSDNEKLICRPEGFRVTVREFEIAAGAGFLIPILGNMMRMPGLPSVPASEGMDIDENGVITGLS